MITVKALEWELVDDDHYAARGLGLGYEVRKSQIRDNVRVRFAGGPFSEWQDFDGDIEAAKSAAQADYTAHIMSAIEPAALEIEPLKAAWIKGRKAWCPAGILADHERTEWDWQEARAALTKEGEQ